MTRSLWLMVYLRHTHRWFSCCAVCGCVGGECAEMKCNMCSDGRLKHAGGGLIPHRRGQTEQLLWQHTGWQTFESLPDAVCLLWRSCYCTLVALWSTAGPHPPCFVPAYQLLSLLPMHVRWHGTSPPTTSSPFLSLYHLLSLSLTSLTLSTRCPVFSPSHLGNLLPLRRQEAVCGHAGKTADGRRREKDVRAVRQHRRVHGAPWTWWHQQR